MLLYCVVFIELARYTIAKHTNNYVVMKVDGIFILHSCLRYMLNSQVIACWIKVLKSEEKFARVTLFKSFMSKSEG
jgi:hypothetical protein